MRYRDVHELSVENPKFFWRQKMDLIDWFEPPTEVLSQDDDGLYRWYVGGKLNTCYLALDHHVDNGRGRQVALYYDSAAAHLSRGHLFVFPAVGHGVLDSHVCAAELVRSFLADPASVRPPECLDRL